MCGVWTSLPYVPITYSLGFNALLCTSFFLNNRDSDRSRPITFRTGDDSGRDHAQVYFFPIRDMAALRTCVRAFPPCSEAGTGVLFCGLFFRYYLDNDGSRQIALRTYPTRNTRRPRSPEPRFSTPSRSWPDTSNFPDPPAKKLHGNKRASGWSIIGWPVPEFSPSEASPRRLASLELPIGCPSAETDRFCYIAPLAD
jgi:hypothetical protein